MTNTTKTILAILLIATAALSGCITDADIAKEDVTLERMVQLETILTDPEISEEEKIAAYTLAHEAITGEKIELKSEVNVTPTVTPTSIPTPTPTVVTVVATPIPTMKLNSPTGYISISEARDYDGDRTGLKMLNARVIAHAPIYDTSVLHICIIEGHTSYWIENVRVEIDGKVVGSYAPEIERESNSYACRITTTINLDSGIENTGSIVIIGTFGEIAGTHIGEYEMACQILTPLEKFDYE